MSQWHTAEATRTGLNVVIHFLVPTGNNAVGVTWKAAALKAGLAGKTASAWADPTETAAILAGDTIEIEAEVSLDRTAALAAQKSVIQAHVNEAIAAKKAEFAGRLKYAGWAEGTVV